MELLLKLLMNGLHGYQIRRNINDDYFSLSEYWLSTEYHERVKDY